MKTTVGGRAAADHAAAARRIVGELEALERERLAFSSADMRGRVRAAGLMREAGFVANIDDAFNVLGRMEAGPAADPGSEQLRPILLGGHLDTVSNAGRFDGPLGLLCGLECARFISESGIPLRHPLVVAGFSDEEGTATDCCWGSRALLGLLSKAERRALADKTSSLNATMVAAAAELGRLGWEVQPARLATQAAAPLEPAAYLELHIDLGPGLLEAGAAVAAVSGIVGIERFAAVFRGQAGHPATVPTAARNDTVVRAAEFVQRYWAVVAALGPRAIVNFGRIETVPGELNVVPHTVRVFIEQRSPDPEVLGDLEAKLRELAAAGDGEVEELMRIAPLDFSPEVRRLTLEAATQTGIECPEQPSWAGHDAEQFATCCPTGMIFVRNIGGVSHCPQELASEVDIAAGLELLSATLRSVDAALD